MKRKKRSERRKKDGSWKSAKRNLRMVRTEKEIYNEEGQEKKERERIKDRERTRKEENGIIMRI